MCSDRWPVEYHSCDYGCRIDNALGTKHTSTKTNENVSMPDAEKEIEMVTYVNKKNYRLNKCDGY